MFGLSRIVALAALFALTACVTRVHEIDPYNVRSFDPPGQDYQPCYRC